MGTAAVRGTGGGGRPPRPAVLGRKPGKRLWFPWNLPVKPRRVKNTPLIFRIVFTFSIKNESGDKILPVARKAAVSLLICVLIFAGFCIFSFTSLFNIIETRFYSRAVFNELNNALAADADFIENYLSELQKRFSDILRENAIRNSFWVNQSGEDIYERGRIFSALAVSLPELQWVRFVRADGNRIDYSTNPDDQI
ncbi:MAG: hypothetical protein LBP37_06970, partial [Spirochaetaceae bacterium]|nr:hypothetical protein [Spirochaetaceae bacterium]